MKRHKQMLIAIEKRVVSGLLVYVDTLLIN